MTDETDAPAPVSIFDLCETDTTDEENGRWFRDFFGDDNNIDFKLRHLTSRAAVKVTQRLQRQNAKKLVNGKFPEDVATDILMRNLAEGVVVDWKNVKDRDGTEIPYSPENAYNLLKKLPRLRDLIFLRANALDSFRIEARADAVGN